MVRFNRRVIGTGPRCYTTGPWCYPEKKTKINFLLECGHLRNKSVKDENAQGAVWPIRLNCMECWEAFLHIGRGEPPWSRVPEDVYRSGQIKKAAESATKKTS